MRSNKSQMPLIEGGEWWQEHWKGMPEFVQEDQTPYKTLYVHFASQEDVDAFAELVKQKIKLNTKYIWYPQITIGSYANKAYVDEASK